jgi:hypothetical protein
LLVFWPWQRWALNIPEVLEQEANIPAATRIRRALRVVFMFTKELKKRGIAKKSNE